MAVRDTGDFLDIFNKHLGEENANATTDMAPSDTVDDEDVETVEASAVTQKKTTAAPTTEVNHGPRKIRVHEAPLVHTDGTKQNRTGYQSQLVRQAWYYLSRGRDVELYAYGNDDTAMMFNIACRLIHAEAPLYGKHVYIKDIMFKERTVRDSTLTSKTVILALLPEEDK